LFLPPTGRVKEESSGTVTNTSENREWLKAFSAGLAAGAHPLESILRGGGTNVAPPTRSTASIAAALQQLGLQLAAVKRSIDLFIIDSEQYPSEN
jgi:uncharacterized protein (TIGR03435 family)